MISTYRKEHTGNPLLDRIQDVIATIVDAVRTLDARFPVVIALQRDFTTTSALATPTPLTFAVKKGETWLVRFWGLAGCSGSANGMKYALLAPTGTEVSGALDSSLTTATDDAHVQITAINTLTSAVHTVNGGTRDDELCLRVKAGGDGKVTLAVASTTSGNTTTLAAKACLRAERYAEVRSV